MSRRAKYAVGVVIAVLSLSLPNLLLAQDDLTLESLAEQLAALTARVERVEALFVGPGARDVDETTCQIGKRRLVQDETVIRYKEQFDEWIDPSDVWWSEIRYSRESGRITIIYADDIPGGYPSDEKYVSEEWDGCEFIGSSDWWEE